MSNAARSQGFQLIQVCSGQVSSPLEPRALWDREIAKPVAAALLGLGRISLRAQARGSGAGAVEVAGQHGRQEGVEDEVGTPDSELA